MCLRYIEATLKGLGVLLGHFCFEDCDLLENDVQVFLQIDQEKIVVSKVTTSSF